MITREQQALLNDLDWSHYPNQIRHANNGARFSEDERLIVASLTWAQVDDYVSRTSVAGIDHDELMQTLYRAYGPFAAPMGADVDAF
jgi:hypothetical protein